MSLVSSTLRGRPEIMAMSSSQPSDQAEAIEQAQSDQWDEERLNAEEQRLREMFLQVRVSLTLTSPLIDMSSFVNSA